MILDLSGKTSKNRRFALWTESPRKSSGRWPQKPLKHWMDCCWSCGTINWLMIRCWSVLLLGICYQKREGYSVERFSQRAAKIYWQEIGVSKIHMSRECNNTVNGYPVKDTSISKVIMMNLFSFLSSVVVSTDSWVAIGTKIYEPKKLLALVYIQSSSHDRLLHCSVEKRDNALARGKD